MIKNLGSIAGIIYSTNEPQNKAVLWRDTANQATKYYDNTLLSWVTMSTSGGTVSVVQGDTPGFLGVKIDSSLMVIDSNKIGVTNPTSAPEKTYWNGKSDIYFVQNKTERNDLIGTIKSKDRIYVAKY